MDRKIVFINKREDDTLVDVFSGKPIDASEIQGVKLIPVSVGEIATLANLRTFFDEVKPYLEQVPSEQENFPQKNYQFK